MILFPLNHLMLQHGVCYGLSINSTEVQWWNTAKVTIRHAAPRSHAPPLPEPITLGNTEKGVPPISGSSVNDGNGHITTETIWWTRHNKDQRENVYWKCEGWKHPIVFYELKHFQIEVLCQTEGLCVVGRNERCVDWKKKRQRSTSNEGPRLPTRLLES